MKLKPIEDQTIVITGASSGIGLATARKAAQRGARLVLVARSGDALAEVVKQITDGGGQAEHVEADVADEAALRRASEVAVERFGGFDTWVNDAGVGLFGLIKETSLDDARRLYDTNVWGVFNGSKIAAEHFRARGERDGHGGCIVNVGSVVGDRAVPIQGVYSSSKFAVKGLTEALRVELEKEGVACYVSLVKPSAIDTPFATHAHNEMERRGTLPPPVYDVELVADAILHAAVKAPRDLYVGTGGALLAKAGQWAPRITDKVMHGFFGSQMDDRPEEARGDDALHGPGGGRYGRERGDIAERGGMVFGHSAYNSAAQHPAVATLAVLAAGTAALAMMGAFSAGDRDDGHRRGRHDRR